MNPRYLTPFWKRPLERSLTDVIVIGAGIAGLYTALKASEKYRVTLITKKTLMDSNTQFAQGGIAAVIAKEDSPSFHFQDTMNAGVGLCSPEAVRILVHEGPECVKELIRLGTKFDVENGNFALTREGAHSHRRILHAQGDATGAEIVRALSEQVRRAEKIQIWENHYAIDLITYQDECYGAVVQKPDGNLVLLQAKATVLCTGGTGQMYRYTTNPEVATGDGIAMAYRAGALIRDMEFIQFHPTVLCFPNAPRFLISEAVRGEGAFLRNIRGERFMQRYHPDMELAPRDVVSRAIVSEMENTGATHVFLDFTHEDPETVKRRFPNIYRTCLKYGLDLASDWIPVAPAAHYMMGGIKTDLYGQSSVKRLFACGEVSSTGIHGANRLASNSLTEAVVFGRRIVQKLVQLEPVKGIWTLEPAEETESRFPSLSVEEIRLQIQKAMLRYAGVRRNASGLKTGLRLLEQQGEWFQGYLNSREQFELANLRTCALLTMQAALAREESRGGHFREDYPHKDDARWQKHIVFHRETGMWEEEIECFKSVGNS